MAGEGRAKTQFKKGQVGNPHGRPRGSGTGQRTLELLRKEALSILKAPDPTGDAKSRLHRIFEDVIAKDPAAFLQFLPKILPKEIEAKSEVSIEAHVSRLVIVQDLGRVMAEYTSTVGNGAPSGSNGSILASADSTTA